MYRSLTVKWFDFFCVIWFVFGVFLMPVIWGQNDKLQKKLFDTDSLIFPQPDSTLLNYKKNYGDAKAAQDTLQQITYLRLIGDFYNDQLDFYKAIESYTDALILSEKIYATLEKAITLNRMGQMYRRFGDIDIGESYVLQAHNLRKECIKSKNCMLVAIIPSYISLLQFARERNNQELALKYLDSCFMISDSIKLPKVQIAKFQQIRANIFNDEGRPNEALKILLPLEKLFDSIIANSQENFKYGKNFISVTYSLGDVHDLLGKTDLALKYYLKSLSLLKRYQTGLVYEPALLSRIAKIYNEKGDHMLAYNYLLEGKALEDKYFKTFSDRNKRFLKLRDNYKEKLEEKENELMDQKLVLAEKEGAILRFRILFMVILLCIVASILLVRNKKAKVKHLKEQMQIRQNAKINEEEAQKKIEYKNKELTTYAMQLMERDDLLDRFAHHLKRADQTKEAKSLIESRRQLGLNTWDEFEKRFVAINKGFYKKLSAKFSELTIIDLKYCALLKLNLSGKEISKLLGVTEKSVHMARYRIRKKLNLNTDDNLLEFLNKF